MIRNLRYWKQIPSRAVLVSVSMALGLTLGGCSFGTNSGYSPLDKNKIDGNIVSYSDVKDYYDEHVDSLIDGMSDMEKDKYYIKVNLKFVGAEEHPDDFIIFLRNDDELKGVAYTNDDQVKLPPGIYRVSSKDYENPFGEFMALSPGDNIEVEINYPNEEIRVADEYRYTVNNSGKTR